MAVETYISGSCTFTLDTDTGLMTVDGTGAMTDYTYSTNTSIPWRSRLTAIKKLVINEGVTTIGGYAFNGCTNLSSVSFPSTLVSVGVRSFDSTAITSAELPDGLLSLSRYAFYNCKNLVSVVLPSNISTIADHTFYQCTALCSINLGNISSVGNYAFYMCTRLCDVDEMVNLTNIDEYAFYGCGFSTFNLGTVSSVPRYAFYNCASLSSISIPSTVTSIGAKAFEGCASLSTVKVYATNPPVADSTSFSSLYANGTLTSVHVPALSYEDYKSATNWSVMADIIVTLPLEPVYADTMVYTGSAFVPVRPKVARKAFQDGNGNTITDTYVRKSEIMSKVEEVLPTALSTNYLTTTQIEQKFVSKSVAQTYPVPDTAWNAETKTATVTAEGVTSDNLVMAGVSPVYEDARLEFGIQVTGQGEGYLVLTCSTVPTRYITIEVTILG